MRLYLKTPLAVEEGWEILQAGGIAFDTAVTVASVLNVVEPMMSGIGWVKEKLQLKGLLCRF